MLELKKKTELNIILFFSFFALASAFFIEYILGHKPCNLCLLQRVPYFLAIILVVLVLILPKFEKSIFLLLALTFLFATFLSFYHFGIEQGFMTTIHSYTTDQRLLDNSHKDLRRARSAPNSIIPTTTGATKSLGDVIPSLKGKVEGISIRVPTPNVSLIEFVFSSTKNLTVEKINNSFIKASKSNLKNILEINNEPLVSSDFNHNSNSAIIDAALTKVIDNKMAKVSAWYDNEWGFACRMCDLANYFGKI